MTIDIVFFIIDFLKNLVLINPNNLKTSLLFHGKKFKKHCIKCTLLRIWGWPPLLRSLLLVLESSIFSAIFLLVSVHF